MASHTYSDIIGISYPIERRLRDRYTYRAGHRAKSQKIYKLLVYPLIPMVILMAYAQVVIDKTEMIFLYTKEYAEAISVVFTSIVIFTMVFY